MSESSSHLPLLMAVCSNICFSTASLYFTDYSRRLSAAWVNFFKAVVAFLAFVLVLFIGSFFGLHWVSLSQEAFWLLIISGLSGLFLGDIFLLKAFTVLGSGRVLMIFGFQPLLLGVGSYFLFQQTLVGAKFIALIFLIGCVFTFSLESYRKKGHWEVKAVVWALIGILLDGLGVLMTRKAFDLSPDVSFIQVNLIRSFVTILGFFVMSGIPAIQFSLTNHLKKLTKKEIRTLILASFSGTAMSLSFYMMAVRQGHLASVSAVVGTSPLFATLFEVMRGRQKVTSYLLVGVGFFLAGFLILVL